MKGGGAEGPCSDPMVFGYSKKIPGDPRTFGINNQSIRQTEVVGRFQTSTMLAKSYHR